MGKILSSEIKYSKEEIKGLGLEITIPQILETYIELKKEEEVEIIGSGEIIKVKKVCVSSILEPSSRSIGETAIFAAPENKLRPEHPRVVNIPKIGYGFGPGDNLKKYLESNFKIIIQQHLGLCSKIITQL